jgi:hypothetical protein
VKSPNVRRRQSLMLGHFTPVTFTRNIRVRAQGGELLQGRVAGRAGGGAGQFRYWFGFCPAAAKLELTSAGGWLAASLNDLAPDLGALVIPVADLHLAAVQVQDGEPEAGPAVTVRVRQEA